MAGTEDFDPQYLDIDDWPTEAAVAAMLDGQRQAIDALDGRVSAIAVAAEAAAARLGRGGRLVYSGAGTSGRVAVQDGVELGPTFGWPQERMAFLLAGGMVALALSAEGAEDDAADGRAQVAAASVGPDDVVIGVAASGRTPFTIAVVEAARAAGALTIVVANNADTPLLDGADHPILADTGSEVLAGSTRMAAGTAQKIVLNLLSTAIMLRLGRVHRGLMVDMIVSNDKLARRARGMVTTLAVCDDATAAAALDAAGRDIKAAVLIARGLNLVSAKRLLAGNGNILRHAIAALECGAT